MSAAWGVCPCRCLPSSPSTPTARCRGRQPCMPLCSRSFWTCRGASPSGRAGRSSLFWGSCSCTAARGTRTCRWRAALTPSTSGPCKRVWRCSARPCSSSLARPSCGTAAAAAATGEAVGYAGRATTAAAERATAAVAPAAASPPPPLEARVWVRRKQRRQRRQRRRRRRRLHKWAQRRRLQADVSTVQLCLAAGAEAEVAMAAAAAVVVAVVAAVAERLCAKWPSPRTPCLCSVPLRRNF
mmetsp:Transcript_86850/g.268932  ORF Transcript_86850/g.268932 Transcript_86850/m.268932 type:complete len:241 (-) Transcript_86850:263-985(-)